MSAAPDEPEKYSIDEMMDRLKSPASESAEEGELVPRADGSQALRVRKRKRRSSQPHKEENSRSRRARIMQVSAALVLVFAAALALGAAVIYANSSLFRKGLVGKIEQTSGATVDLQVFRMNPKTANAGDLALSWPEGNILKTLALHGLEAEIFPASFLGKSLTGEEISVAYGNLVLRIPKPALPLRNFPAVDGESPIRFNRYRVPNFDLTLGDSAAPVIQLLKCEASLAPSNINGRPQLSLYRGSLAIAGWPKLRLDRSLIVFRGQEADVIGLRVLHETDDRGALDLTGSVSPYKPEQLATLAVSMDGFQLSGLTGPALGRLISGQVDSLPLAKSNYLSFFPSDQPSAKLDIAFRATPTSRIEVQGFPFLFGLGQTLDDPWFERPVFEGDAGAILHRELGVVSLRDIHFESKDYLSLRGEITIAPDQTLSGTLHVGVADPVIATAKTSRLKTLFGPPRDGFRWLTLKISGPASAPVDNFKQLFSATPVAETLPPPPGGGSSFEELTRPK